MSKTLGMSPPVLRHGDLEHTGGHMVVVVVVVEVVCACVCVWTEMSNCEDYYDHRLDSPS